MSARSIRSVSAEAGDPRRRLFAHAEGVGHASPVNALVQEHAGLMKRRNCRRDAFPSIRLLAECPTKAKNPPPQPSPTRAGGSLNRARGHEIAAFPRNKNQGQRSDQRTAQG